MAKKKEKERVSYDLIDLEKVKKLAAMGVPEPLIRDFFEISSSTWSRWRLEHPEFLEALTARDEDAVKAVEKVLYHKAIGFVQEYKKLEGVDDKTGEPIYSDQTKQYLPDLGAIKFFLVNKAPDSWQDRKTNDVEVRGDFAASILRARKRIGKGAKQDVIEAMDFLE